MSSKPAAAHDALSDAKKREAIRQAQLFFAFYLAKFHSLLALMVHGATLTTLVPAAISGDQDCFCKAIQIDRTLAAHHPYFRQRKLDAQERGETDFLGKINYRENAPTLRGRIRYPALYFVFACLDAAERLDDFTHSEILDICDEAGLDRYQNRIEDVNYLTKRLHGYRMFQKRGTLSMQ